MIWSTYCWCNTPTVFEVAGDRIDSIDQELVSLQARMKRLQQERVECVRLRRNPKSKRISHIEQYLRQKADGK